MHKLSKFQRDVFLLFTAEMVWVIGYSMFTNYFPLYIKELGGNEFSVSFIASIPMFMGVFSIVGGILSDLIDRKYIILFGWGITIPAPLIWALATDWKWLVVGQFIASLTMVCAPAITLYIFDYKDLQNPEGSKMMAYSAIHIASTAGSLIGPLAGSKIIQMFSMKTLFWVVCLFYCLGTLFILPMMSQKPNKKIKLTEYFSVGDVRKNYNVKKLLIFAGFICLIVYAQNISEPYLSIFLNSYKKVSLDWIGICFTVVSIGAMLFTWSFSKIEEYAKLKWLILGGMVLFISSVPLLLSGNGLPMLAAGFFLRSVNRAVSVYLNGVFARSLSENRKGVILSIFISSRSIVSGLGSFTGAALYRVGAVIPFIFEAILVIILAGVTFIKLFKNDLNGKKRVDLSKDTLNSEKEELI